VVISLRKDIVTFPESNGNAGSNLGNKSGQSSVSRGLPAEFLIDSNQFKNWF
jgi:hypothetical protein